MHPMGHPVVHLELHTGDLDRACRFYAQLCGWSTERVTTSAGTYRSLDPGNGLSGGVVECEVRRPLWLPYVEVAEIRTATARARELGAEVLLDSREGPAGWRSVITAPDAGGLALWQSKG